MEETEPPVYFGEWLKLRRKELDLTQAELAQLAGCSVPALRKVEAGVRRPSKQLARLLAQWEKRLTRLLQEIKAEYAYIFIDCPPSLGLLTINSLAAAHSVLIPLQCENYAMEGLTQLLKTIRLVKQAFNPALEIEGILLTMFDSRNNLAHQVVQELQTHFKDKVFKTFIPRNVRLSEAPSHGKPVLMYDILSKGAESYLDLAREILNNGQRNSG